MLPKVVSLYGNNVANTLNFESIVFNAYEVKIPDVDIPTITINFGGSEINLSSHARGTEQDLTFNFELDSKFLNYTTVYQWLNAMHDDEDGLFDTKHMVSTGTEDKEIPILYLGNITIQILDEADTVIGEYFFVDVVPNKLGGPQLNYRLDNTAGLKSSVSFKYARFTWRPVVLS